MEAECWWRDDIDRRLDGLPAIKWTYAEILSGQDMLTVLLGAGITDDRERRTTAVRAYVADQFEADRQVRFKQIELQNDLFDLFIDILLVPIDRGAEDDLQAVFRKHIHRLRRLEASSKDPDLGDRDADENPVVYREHDISSMGAATALLDANFQEDFPRVVLEGAPGQGKSTLVQYVAQAHRVRLLSGNGPLLELALPGRANQFTCARLPFKIDLRDLATWTTGKDPFVPTNDKRTSAAWDASLEAFMAAQVMHHSGGVAFAVADLLSVARASPILLVLDGFDEVADVERRREVVKTITSAIPRLKANTLSLQVVITSRPAAFAKSPGFPEAEFPHFELQSVTIPQALTYARKWVAARNLPHRERRSFLATFEDKLGQSHLRDLARNPMQLAILLSLVHTGGSSLPDKRTALYDHYVDLFFSREAEKSTVVREFRDLLVDLHRYVGWELHCSAELDPNGGAIGEKAFLELIRKYLSDEGHDTSIVDSLFQGMVERVVALVSRIQGTYEFEVQPLREYFAARHLYETAPYSPTGNERAGTKPDRFHALARNSYWLNVTRFFGGCFSKGELPALADSLEELWKEEPYRYLEQPKILGAMLLSDWVFSQHPKAQQRCTVDLFKGATLRHVARGVHGGRHSGNPFIFSVTTARAAVLDRCFRNLATDQKRDYEVGLCALVRANGSEEEVYARWRSELMEAANLSPRRLLWLAIDLGVVGRVSTAQMEEFLGKAYEKCLPLIVFADRGDVYCASAARYEDAVSIVAARPFSMRRSKRSLLAALARAFDVEMFEFALREHRHIRGESFRDVAGMYHDFRDGMAETKAGSDGECDFELQQRVRDLLAVFASESGRPVAEWATSLEPWDNFVEEIRSTLGARWVAYRIAKIAASGLPPAATPAEELHLLDQALPLCSRAVAARRFADDAEWWRICLREASNSDEIGFVIMLMFDVAGDSVICRNLELIDTALENLPNDRWACVFNEFVHFRRPSRSSRRFKIPEADLPGEASGRFCALLALQSKAECAAEIYIKRLLDYSGQDIHVWSACIDLAIVAAQRRRTLWPQVLLPLRRGYDQGALPTAAGSLGLYTRADDTLRMPVEVAAEICKDADLYPLMVLDRAETALQVHVGQNRTSISEIARRDGWFDTNP